ncbi:hypothetical protein F4778DRAFT_786798 [Xylariomycetidae sp. FL2044]|nr:hypothetical protein F4778DRAFT_786798 [Xylariomycetidae sp. FL2044]
MAEQRSGTAIGTGTGTGGEDTRRTTTTMNTTTTTTTRPSRSQRQPRSGQRRPDRNIINNNNHARRAAGAGTSSPAVLEFTKKWRRIDSSLNIVLTLSSLALCFTIFALALDIAVGGTRNPPPTIYWMAPLTIFTGIWDGAELLFLCARNRGMHPGAHIAIDIVLCLAMVSCVFLTAAVYGVTAAVKPEFSEACQTMYCRDDRRDAEVAERYSKFLAAMLGLLAVLVFVHICIFLRATLVIYNDKRIKAKEAEAAAQEQIARYDGTSAYHDIPMVPRPPRHSYGPPRVPASNSSSRRVSNPAPPRDRSSVTGFYGPPPAVFEFAATILMYFELLPKIPRFPGPCINPTSDVFA